MTVPIVIAYLGLDSYGIWSIIMTIAGYMRFGSAGVKSAFQKYVAEATGSGDYLKANRLLSTGSVGMLGLSMTGLLPLAFYATEITQLMGVPSQLAQGTTRAITLLAFMMICANVGAAYEAIVMGGHRTDLVRKIGAAFTVFEAAAIVGVLVAGYGLVAMTTIMVTSEILYLVSCYFIARHVLPEIQLSVHHVSRKTVKELLSYAGSYQLVGMLEVIYAALLPITILKLFGAALAGEYAIAHRLVWAALLLADAILPPLLSTGTMLYASGSLEDMKVLLVKSFKAAFVLSILPLAFVGVYGTLIVQVWTGLKHPEFAPILALMCMAGLFRGLSLLQLVLYRASGNSSMDNIRQILRLGIIVLACGFGESIGLVGVIGGLVFAEFIGFLFMFYPLNQVYQGFTARLLAADIVKLLAATAVIIVVSMASVIVFLPAGDMGRATSLLKLGVATVTVAAATWPILRLTGALSLYELRAVMGRSM